MGCQAAHLTCSMLCRPKHACVCQSALHLSLNFLLCLILSHPSPCRARRFADKYKHRKAQEELTNLKSKYGDVDINAGSSSSESEDSAAEMDTPQTEKDFFRTLAALKADRKELYDQETVFYREDAAEDGAGDEEGGVKAKKEKPVYLRDHERNRLLTRGDQAFVSDSEEEEGPDTGAAAADGESYVDRQARLKRRFLASAAGLGEEDDLLQSRSKSTAEVARDEADYSAWLASSEGAALATQDKEQLEPLRRFWSDPKLSEDDKFLRDYLTKHLWRQEGPAIPTYREVIDSGPIDEELDAEAVAAQEEYENKFNFVSPPLFRNLLSCIHSPLYC